MKLKVAALTLLLLGGCTTGSPEAGPSENPSSPPKEQTTEAPPPWAAPDSYSFELKSSCGERSLIGRFHVVVKDGEVRARALDERARTFMRFEEEFGGVPSIEDLLEEVEEARRQDADVVEVEFDPTDGHPTQIDIDYNEQAIDDEACYVISNYAERIDCNGLCISDATVTAGQEVTITFAPPKDQIWGVSAEIRLAGSTKQVAWLAGYRDDPILKTVWPGPNIGFEDIGFYGPAEWSWTVPRRLEPGRYEISKESIRDGTDPIEERINEWTVSFNVTD